MSSLPIQQRSNIQRNQIVITKKHIVAVSMTTVFLSLFTGVIGYQSGRKHVGIEEPYSIVPSILPDVEKQKSLEALLVEIEATNRHRSDTDFMFPNELMNNTPMPTPAEPELVHTETVIDANDVVPMELPKISNRTIPSSGWAVQIGSYPTLEEAEQAAQEWDKKGTLPYIVSASISNEVWYRVRLAGFDSKAVAQTEKERLEQELQEFDFIVVKAP